MIEPVNRGVPFPNPSAACAFESKDGAFAYQERDTAQNAEAAADDF
jgi:hypothetical protein